MPGLARDLALCVGALLTCAAQPGHARQSILLIAEEPGSWSRIFASVGLSVTQANHLPAPALRTLVERGGFAILEGESEFASSLGIKAGRRKIPTRSVTDVHNPGLSIVWQHSVDLPEFTIPAHAVVFTRERWTNVPVVVAIREGKGAYLWLATRPGSRGYERYPYILQALTSLGLEVPFRSNRLWAFFDSSYRRRADIEYLADNWSKAGISAIHVAAWQYFESSPVNDSWLAQVIEACHRRGILVYAWLELPHVSEAFWRDHPEWREKTAVGQDAFLDWRKLMNLHDRDCARAVESGVRELLARFDWDGVNLAELYFESLEGMDNPARFTPMNDTIRREFQNLTEVDPLTLFKAEASKETKQAFLNYRAELARRLQEEWMAIVEDVRRESRPHLDLVLTHIDDRFDERIPSLLGADTTRVLPMLNRHDFTFLIEDPATIWHLGPDRYREIAARYKPITSKTDKLAIDINIVPRYQNVYPTKQQTGLELFQLVQTAASAFARVALYFETSILKPDLGLLPASAAAVSRFEQRGSSTVVESPYGVGMQWRGVPLVDGRPWPLVSSDGVVWLPAGPHVMEDGGTMPALRVERLNCDVQAAALRGAKVEISYRSSARALITLSHRPTQIEVDGERIEPVWFGERTLVLPRGQHIVTLSP